MKKNISAATISLLSIFCSRAALGQSFVDSDLFTEVANETLQEVGIEGSEEEYNQAFLQNLRRELSQEGELVYDVPGLNPKEDELYRKDRGSALKVFANAATAKQSASTRWSSETLQLGNGDAFRHCYWNGLMVLSVGFQLAKSWGDAHEYGAPGNNGLSRDMDLYNNGVGLGHGLTHQDGQSSNLPQACMTSAKSGQLKRVVGNTLVYTDASGSLVN